MATALGIEAASFLIFPGPCSGKNQKNIAESPTFFSDLQGFENLAGQKKGNAQEFDYGTPRRTYLIEGADWF